MSFRDSDEPKMSMWTALSDLFMARMDDLIYAELLFLSIIFSLLMRCIKAGLIREVFSGLVGIFMVHYFTGVRVLYSLASVFLTIAVHAFAPHRYLGLTSFLVSFLYLGCLRAVHIFHLPALVSHANAVQLIITLRDARNWEQGHDHNKKRIVQEPSWLKVFLYAYSFPGLFTGPYYTYAMYQDVITNDSIMNVSVWHHIKWRLYNVLWACPAFILLVYVFPLDTMRKEEFFDETIFYKIYTSIFVFFWMRCRMYSAWMIAESICVLNGIGLYPKISNPRVGCGPTKEFAEIIFNEDTEISSEAIHNVDIVHCEFDSTFRGGIRAWNSSVQYWLAVYVYKRVPRAFGMILTMTASAYWHGIHLGYYLSFLTVPLCTFAESMFLSVMPKNTYGKPPVIVQLIWYIIRQLGFAYMAAGFLLLSYEDTVRYWNSVHFYIHWIMGSIICVVWFYKALYLTAIVNKGTEEATEFRGNGDAKNKNNLDSMLEEKKWQ